MACYGPNDYYVWDRRYQEMRGRNSTELNIGSTETN